MHKQEYIFKTDRYLTVLDEATEVALMPPYATQYPIFCIIYPSKHGAICSTRLHERPQYPLLSTICTSYVLYACSAAVPTRRLVCFFPAGSLCGVNVDGLFVHLYKTTKTAAKKNLVAVAECPPFRPDLSCPLLYMFICLSVCPAV